MAGGAWVEAATAVGFPDIEYGSLREARVPADVSRASISRSSGSRLQNCSRNLYQQAGDARTAAELVIHFSSSSISHREPWSVEQPYSTRHPAAVAKLWELFLIELTPGLVERSLNGA